MVEIKFKTNPYYGSVAHAEEVPFPDTEQALLDLIHKDVGALFDVVYIGHGIDMIIDDEGSPMFKPDAIPNPIATALRTIYWAKSSDIVVPAYTAPIYGQVMLMSCDKEGNSIDLNEEQLSYVKSLINI